MAMQQSSIGGLFGIGQNQEDLVAKIRAEQQARNQAMTQNLGKYAGLAQSGMESAQQFGGMLGVQDPRLKRNTQIIAARDAVRAKGITDPEEQIAELVKELSARGLYDEADRATQRLLEAKDAKRKAGLEERRVAADEARVKQGEAPKAEATTVNGVAVYRAPNGAPFVYENGKQVPYNPQVHGRLQTQMDKPATGIAGMLGGLPTPAAGTPTAQGQPTQTVQTYEDLRKKLEAKKAMK